MIKAALFIDGTWLYQHIRLISDERNYLADFVKLPSVIGDELSHRMAVPTIITRINMFGQYAVNYSASPGDDEAVRRRTDFYSLMARDCRVDVSAYPINYFGRPLKRQDRNPGDNFVVHDEIQVAAMSAAMVEQAMTPGSFDLAVCVLGFAAFSEPIRVMRRHGRQTILVSVDTACAGGLVDPPHDEGLFDYDPIWLDDLRGPLELIWEERELECENPTCKGPRIIRTTFKPRRGQRFYCNPCRQAHADKRARSIEAGA